MISEKYTNKIITALAMTATITATLILFLPLPVPVSAAFESYDPDKAGTLNIQAANDVNKLSSIYDTCEDRFRLNDTTALDPCYRIVNRYHEYMKSFFNESKDDIMKIMVEP